MQKHVGLDPKAIAQQESQESKLKRTLTPHYTKNQRVSVFSSFNLLLKNLLIIDRSSQISRASVSGERTVTIKKGASGLGLSIAGGVGSTPYKGDDHVSATLAFIQKFCEIVFLSSERLHLARHARRPRRPGRRQAGR